MGLGVAVSLDEGSTEERDRAVVRGEEVTATHTRLLRVPLVVDDSRSYWEHFRPTIPHADLPRVALEERWFGSRTMARVRGLLATLQWRFGQYPVALRVLAGWRPSDPAARRLICHWHTQLTDPIYRDFTGAFLVYRRSMAERTVDRDVVARWVRDHTQDRWASATTLRMANSLLTTAAEAGLCAAGAGQREVLFPKVPDDALTYLLYLLRETAYEGTLLDNPYLASVGLTEGFVEAHLRRLPALAFGRMGELHDFGWEFPDLETWATARGFFSDAEA